MKLPGAPLSDADVAKLVRCGIPAELAASALLRRVSSAEGGALIGRNGSGDYSGIAYAFTRPGAGHVHEYRLRLDHPTLERKEDGSVKESQKYLSPPGARNMIYFVPGTDQAWLADPTLPIIVTEGEKKCLALWNLAHHGVGDSATRPRWLPIGLTGCWNWKGQNGIGPGPEGDRRPIKGTIPDLDLIDWKGRRVPILFDADTATNPDVWRARHFLARELSSKKRGAIVETIDIPTDAGEKGIDDLIGRWGLDRSLEFIRTAAKPWNARKQQSESEHAAAGFGVADIKPVREYSAAPITYVLEGILAEGTVTLLTGDSGAGKTTLGTAIGYAIANGVPFAGLDTNRRPVLLLDRENPLSVVVERLDRLRIVDESALKIWGGWCPSEPPGPTSSELVAWVASCKAKPVLIFDSWISFYTGQSENDSAEVRRFMQGFRTLADMGATVVSLHHSGKGENTKDFRGSTDLKAAIDSGWHLANFGESQLDRMRLRAWKCRFAVGSEHLIRYVDGAFQMQKSSGMRTVSELLGDLLKANPGIRTADFEKLAVDKKLGRDRARQFLENGITTGYVRQERGDHNTRHHFWVSPNGAK